MTIWDFYHSDPVGEIKIDERFYCMRMSNNGEYIAMGSENGEIWVFKSKNLEFIGKSQGHSMAVNHIKWSPDDKQFVSVSLDNSVCVWNFYMIKN
jgi:WD40 repeat protein